MALRSIVYTRYDFRMTKKQRMVNHMKNNFMQSTSAETSYNVQPKPLSRWGMARRDYLHEFNMLLVVQFGPIEFHKHCLEIEEQAIQRKRNMMAAIRNDPSNKVTENDKAHDPIAWVGRMNNFQAMVHEVIYNELIFS